MSGHDFELVRFFFKCPTILIDQMGNLYVLFFSEVSMWLV